MKVTGWILATLTALSILPLSARAQSSQLPGDVLNYLRFVDLRDLFAHDTQLSGTSNLIMKTLEEDPERLLGKGKSYLSFYRSGAVGPKGSKVRSNGKSVYSYSDENDGSETRINTVLGLDFEDILVEDIERGLEEAQVFRLRLLLFAHDKNRITDPYYFRRINIRVDWTIPRERADERVQFIELIEEIPLALTSFKVDGDLLERKVILHDDRFGITKVFPIGVGSFDVRTAYGMDNHVSLMTYEFRNATLKKTKVNKGSIPNVRSRIYPSYYKGRPFIAIYDADQGYRQIGLHYQIDSDGLRRGFVSHGCIRVEDKHLYQLDVIVNEGPKDEIPINMVYNLEGFDDIFHPMPKLDLEYNIVNYSDRPGPRVWDKKKNDWTTKWIHSIKCPNSSYSTRYYGDIFHTIADSDCLTKVSKRSGNVYEITSYMKGLSSNLPLAYTSSDNHVPTGQMSTEGGEVEAGNRNSENLKELFKKLKNTPGLY
ncbi:murein L,D-transpeptidase [bacterium]|nr:murein L,D-transpeptidase [bacterium]